MIKQLQHMPAGTVGVAASGKVTAEDYRDVLVPMLATALEQGGVRLLYVVEDDTSFTPGAAMADVRLAFKSLKGWERIAVVTDADWIENSIKAFGWMMPGEVRVFDDDEVDDAKRWLTEPD
jgi:hypothetical protein